MSEKRCSYCGGTAVDYDVLFHPWCAECTIRKWLMNWGAQHQWLSQDFLFLHREHAPGKEQWYQFASSAPQGEIERLWLRIALYQRHTTTPRYLGTEHTHISLPPPDRDIIHNGTTFRNEWEAKWACFFEMLQVEYDYQYGIGYQPDQLPGSTAFWLPKLSWFHRPHSKHEEVALDWEQTFEGAYLLVTGPTPHTLEQERQAHAQQFATSTGLPVFLLEGFIGVPTNWDGYTISYLTPSGESTRPFLWHECQACGTIGLFHELLPAQHLCRCPQPIYRTTTTRLIAAYVAARYARFPPDTLLLPTGTA